MARRAKGINWDSKRIRSRLGVDSDYDIARDLGVRAQTVWHARRRRGIPPAQPRPPRWTPEALALLGTAPDEEIAARVGVSVVAAKRAREKRGIPAAERDTSAEARRWDERLVGVLREHGPSSVVRVTRLLEQLGEPTDRRVVGRRLHEARERGAVRRTDAGVWWV